MSYPAFIDLCAAPYNIDPDLTVGGAPTATNWTAQFDAAMADAAVATGPIDAGGVAGGVVYSSKKGIIKLDAGRIIPQGVHLRGANKHATKFKLDSMTSDPTKDFFTLGSPADGLASFGSKITDCGLMSDQNFDVPRGAAMIKSYDNQDTTDMLQHLQIFSGARAWIWLERGDGGATSMDLHDIQGASQWTTNPSIFVDVSDKTLVRMDLIEPANGRGPDGLPVSGSVGMELRNGKFIIDRFHPEILHIGVQIGASAGSSYVIMRDSEGHPECRFFCLLDAGNPVGSVGFQRTYPEGSNVMLYNNRNPAAPTTSTAGYKLETWV